MNNSSIFLSYCLAFSFHLEISWSLVIFYVLLVSGQGLKLGEFHFHPKAYGHKHFHLGLDSWMLYSQSTLPLHLLRTSLLAQKRSWCIIWWWGLGLDHHGGSCRPTWGFPRVHPGWHAVVLLWIQKIIVLNLDPCWMVRMKFIVLSVIRHRYNTGTAASLWPPWVAVTRNMRVTTVKF